MGLLHSIEGPQGFSVRAADSDALLPGLIERGGWKGKSVVMSVTRGQVELGAEYKHETPLLQQGGQEVYRSFGTRK